VNFIVENWTLIAVALTSGAMLMWPLVKGATGGALSPAGAVQLINRERGVVVDIREPAEFAAGHVGAPGARRASRANWVTTRPKPWRAG
jgi:hypothetical protein